MLDHYGVRPDAHTPGRGHENGDVEQAHHRFKRAVEQALLLRGQRDFDSQAHSAQFLRAILTGRNRGRQARLQDELPHMHALPSTRLEDFRVLRVRVNRFSMIRVGPNVYSVASRLIGETVEVRVYPERLEVRYAGEGGRPSIGCGGAGRPPLTIGICRHLIGSLVRKPGAFARYRYQATLFPPTTFRRAYDALTACYGSRADVEYGRLLQLAARTSACAVETVLGRLLDGGTRWDVMQVKALVQPDGIAVPSCALPPPALSVYDACLEAGGGGR